MLNFSRYEILIINTIDYYFIFIFLTKLEGMIILIHNIKAGADPQTNA